MGVLLDEGDELLLDEGGFTLFDEGEFGDPAGGIAQYAIGQHAIAGDYLPDVVVLAPDPPTYPDLLYTIDLCHDWVRIGEAPAAVFDAVTRNLALGEWRLVGAVAALDFQTGHTLTDVNTIRIVRDKDIVYSGYVASVASGTGGLHLVETADGQQFTLTGGDAWSVLNSRICYPTPATPPPWADSHDVRTGLASTAAAGYITANTGGATFAERQIPGLTVIDELAGSTGSWSARLQPLDQQVARVCRDGGITCRFVVDYAGAITATLRNPANRAGSIVISDQGDLTNIQHIVVPATATYVVSGGQGNLTARTFATAGTATGTARRERFDDESALSTATEVAQSATTKLAQGAATLTVRCELTDFAASKLRWLLDYDIGDTIAVEIDDVRYPVPIESVTFHIGPDRAVIRPVLGDAAPDLVTGLIRDVASLQNRFETTIA